MMLDGMVMAMAAALLAPQASTDTIPLFAEEEPLAFTLTADFDQLRGDREDDPPERPATVTLEDGSGRVVQVGAQLRTRGRFRREASNCSFPPLRLNLKKKQTEGTPLAGQDKLKIVGSCRPNRDSYGQLVLLEYLTYRALEAVTDVSFRTRLARITYVDESGKNETDTRWAFLIEDDEALAARLGGTVFDLEEGKNMPPAYLEPVVATTAAIFQYMIGNTDWSDVAGHNVELIELHGIAVPVPYDFDFAGLVDAPYAIPAPELHIKSVKERYYRGWCRDALGPPSVLDRFRAAEGEIIALFEEFEPLDDGERDRAVRYLRAFFEEIETDERAERAFLRDCRAIPRG